MAARFMALELLFVGLLGTSRAKALGKRAPQTSLQATSTATSTSCSTRQLGGAIPRGITFEDAGVWWSDHLSYQTCTHEQHIQGYCGSFQSINFRSCMTEHDNGMSTKEMVVGPIITRGGNDWSAVQ